MREKGVYLEEGSFVGYFGGGDYVLEVCWYVAVDCFVEAMGVLVGGVEGISRGGSGMFWCGSQSLLSIIHCHIFLSRVSTIQNFRDPTQSM